MSEKSQRNLWIYHHGDPTTLLSRSKQGSLGAIEEPCLFLNLKEILYSEKKRKVRCGVRTENVDKDRTREMWHHSLEGQINSQHGLPMPGSQNLAASKEQKPSPRSNQSWKIQVSPFPICFLRTTLSEDRACSSRLGKMVAGPTREPCLLTYLRLLKSRH